MRKAKNTDSEVLLSLLEEAREYKISLGDDAWGEHPFTQEDVALRLKTGCCYVLEVNGVLVGSTMLIWNDEHNWGNLGRDGNAGYVHGLMVNRDFQGQNFGKNIIDWAAKQIKAKGRQFIRLDCRSENLKLCAYYENLGFEKIDSKDGSAFYQRAV